MSDKKSTAVTTAKDNEALQALQDSYPVEQGFQRTFLPRLGMISQDVLEEIKNPKTGKKELKIVTEAGTFFTDRSTDEVDEETGKNIWIKDELGDSIEAVVLFKRKQLRFYDSANQSYTSSAPYDSDDEIIKLFCNKSEVDSGTPKELKSRPEYQGVSAKGKPISKLEDNRILFVLYKGEIFQMTLRGTSMYAFMTYEKKTFVPSVLTTFSSEPKENGATKWNQMTFVPKKNLSTKEIEEVADLVAQIKNGIDEEKAFFADKNEASNKNDEIIKDLREGSSPKVQRIKGPKGF